MESLIQTISTIAIMVLGGVTFYLSQKKAWHTFLAVGQSCMKWFCFLLVVLLLMRFVILFDMNLLTVQRAVNSFAFFVTVTGITWSVAHYERTVKR